MDAADQLEKKSPKADENIRLIRSNLDDAVDVCIRAASQEFGLHWQKQLLRAASFGKSVLDFYNSDEFVTTCETLRVLNSVRDYRIGLPLSYDQYIRLTPQKLIQRLINRQEYLLAIRVSEYLHLSTDKIYVHWASQKVRNSTSDEESICNTIVTRLKDKHGVSFETIARAAYDEGRGHLATELLNHEPRAGKQVPLLLSMEEDDLALDKAISSGDTDLVFFVLLHLKRKLPLASFFRSINDRPLASALVESSAASQDTSLLKDLYYQDDRRLDGSNLLFAEALAQSALQTKSDKLKLASKLLSDSKDPPSLFHTKTHSEAILLLRLQDSLDHDFPPPPSSSSSTQPSSSSSSTSFSGLSLHQTLHRLIHTGHSKRAQKIQSDFHLSEKSWSWIRLRALVAARNWPELDDLSRARKPAIGWEPYFNEILAAGNARSAALFVPKCTQLSPQERCEMFVKCGLVGKGAEELYRGKDLAGLEALRGRAGAAAAEVERMITLLKPKR